MSYAHRYVYLKNNFNDRLCTAYVNLNSSKLIYAAHKLCDTLFAVYRHHERMRLLDLPEATVVRATWVFGPAIDDFILAINESNFNPSDPATVLAKILLKNLPSKYKDNAEFKAWLAPSNSMITFLLGNFPPQRRYGVNRSLVRDIGDMLNLIKSKRTDLPSFDGEPAVPNTILYTDDPTDYGFYQLYPWMQRVQIPALNHSMFDV